MKRSPPW